MNDDLFVALDQGPDHRDYYETCRTYSNGRTKLLRSWYNYGVDYGKRSNVREYYYNAAHVDGMGNWFYAEDQHRQRNAYIRELFYYDTPQYNAEEDANIDTRIEELVAAVDRSENPFNIENLPVMFFGLIAKALYIFGLFVLFMMTFFRSKLYSWFDLRAARKITPRGNGLICKALWSALLPVAIAFLPTAAYIYGGHSTAVVPRNLVIDTLAALGIALVYCLIYILLRKRKVTARAALWELMYSATIWICLWAAVILAIYIAVMALIILFFVGMVTGKSNSDDESITVISSEYEQQTLSRISNGRYIDSNGNIYIGSSSNVQRLSDGKRFS